MGRPLALVTGAGRRIGAAIARRLHARHDLVIHARRSRADAETVAAQLNAARPGSATVVLGDLESVDDLERIAASVAGRPLAVLVHNASRFSRCNDSFDAAWGDALRAHMRTNLEAPILLTRLVRDAFADATRHGRSPACIWLLDTHRDGVFPDFSAYALSRAAGAAAVSMLAHALAPTVRVVGVAPNTVLWSERESRAITESTALGQTLTRRMGTPDDVADAVAFVADNTLVNGTILALDGGRSSWWARDSTNQ